jgi:hypothetical protein
MINLEYPQIHIHKRLLQLQKIIGLQNVANKLSDEFVDYKGLMRSLNPTVNAPERVEVPNKITQVPSIMKTREGYNHQEG